MTGLPRKVGIEKIGAYAGELSLDLGELCVARGGDPGPLRDVMMLHERTVPAPWEDPVTMAVAAAAVLSEEERARIGLLVVSSESGVDQEKPMSTWVQRHLGLRSDVRNFEVKHACYGATGSMQLAASWIASGLARGRTALVINTDISRMHLGKPWEFVMGAAAVAVLVSEDPRMLEIELGMSGVYTNEVSDLTRPTPHVETGNSETSLLSYMDALESSFDRYLEVCPEARDYDRHFDRNVYHLPFGGMGFRAHKALLRRVGITKKDEVRAHFARKTQSSLRYVRRMGGTYGSSTFLGLLGLFAEDETLEPGERVSLFSYGSGSCAEFWSGKVGPEARTRARQAGLDARLDRRRPLTVPEYERLEGERTARVLDGDYDVDLDAAAPHDSPLRFRGMKDFYRVYEDGAPIRATQTSGLEQPT